MSSSGQYMLTTGKDIDSSYNVLRSTDYGETWTTNLVNASTSYYSINMSGDGKYAIITYLTSDIPRLSSDYGATWSSINTASVTLDSALSSNGKYQTYCTYSTGEIYVSSDYGANWSIKNGIFASGVSMSSDGKYQLITGYATNILGYSSDYGDNWTFRTVFSGPTPDAQRFSAISSSGQFQYLCATKDGVYISSDYGITFTRVITSTTDNKRWFCITCSSSGQYVAVGNLEGEIYVSIDYGNNWVKLCTFPNFVRTLLLSSTGQILSAGIENTGVYVIKYFVTPNLPNTTTTLPTVMYEPTNNTIFYNNGVTKTFVIPHPTNNNKYLVHGCLEGPEGGVYYRGKGTIFNNKYTEIILPDYADKIANDFTILVTPLCNELYYSSAFENNIFKVFGKNGSFFWFAQGKRSAINYEPDISSVSVKGEGPYKWI
jgi:photosystem II stability/assembly factor-like uncharacterized protein